MSVKVILLLPPESVANTPLIVGKSGPPAGGS